MWGGSISSRSPFRNLHRDGPVLVVWVIAPGCLEVQLLEAVRNRPHLAGSNRAAVDLHDGCDLVPGPGEEYLISCVELRPVNVALFYGHPQLPLRELHDSVARNAFQ